MDDPGEGWITGSVEGKEGIFPSNYVTFVVAKASHDFAGEEEDELNFDKGDIITVNSVDDPGEGWYSGEHNGADGMFPANYIEWVSADAPAEAVAEPAATAAEPAEQVGATHHILALVSGLADACRRGESCRGACSMPLFDCSGLTVLLVAIAG